MTQTSQPDLAQDLLALPELVNALRVRGYTLTTPEIRSITNDADFQRLADIAVRLGTTGRDLAIIEKLQSEVAELHNYLVDFRTITGGGRLVERVKQLVRYFSSTGRNGKGGKKYGA